MTATPLLGRPVADRVLADVEGRVAALAAQGRPVGLATVQVGDDPASEVYLGTKHKAAGRVGMTSSSHRLPADATMGDVVGLVESLNVDGATNGMIVQLPIPDHLDEMAVIDAIAPTKDADGLHPNNLGLLAQGRPRFVPATPQGVMEMLDFYDVDVAGRLVTVIGRSMLVGRPLALLLGLKGTDATVVQAHSRSRDLADLCRQSDVVIVAAGRPGLLTPDMVKPGSTLVDVGINRTDDGLEGDIDPECAEVAGAMSPVPKGVGPLTVACLLRNTVAAAERFHEAR